MRFYNNLFAAYNSILRIMKSNDTEYTAIILVCLSQGLHFFVFIGIVREIFGVSLLYSGFPTYYYLILFVPWAFFVHRYYSKPKDRIETILKRFSEKSDIAKVFWGIVAFITIMIPIIVFPILFRKNN